MRLMSRMRAPLHRRSRGHARLCVAALDLDPVSFDPRPVESDGPADPVERLTGELDVTRIDPHVHRERVERPGEDGRRVQLAGG